MALLARFSCGCKRRVEIPAPALVRCDLHGAVARLVSTPRGQVRYEAVSSMPAAPGVDDDRPSEHGAAPA